MLRESFETLALERMQESSRTAGGVRVYGALFRWENDASDAYITMCILGHTSLQESLVYTTYHVGDDFRRRSASGEAILPHIRRRKVGHLQP